ncbi:glycosyltransferase family 2 protein [Chryseolinea lacunae]|uniref:Glycosyltransferase family 2 protein n=1 Tax=Chryseolinea lacunae TaxID=2801331 RepID=A0ABS1KXM7_9BACT|nr:glycosyltransferase family 2 protein [Chryseolinea lacunae]MBL0744228.1 glycosyltransferase family 2 protein [Chryseolinea lacunae]
MDTLSIFLFWLGSAIVLYTYVGYGIVVYLLVKLRPKATPIQPQTDQDLPNVTLLIAAYNEAPYLESKIRNTLSLDYPKDKLFIKFVTDGSNDNSGEILQRYPVIEAYHEPERRGKIHAVNRVMKLVTTPIVIFCDANTDLNDQAIRLIVRHYQQPEVGGVAGEKRIFKKAEDNASGAGEGLYWKYESFLKKKDSELHSIVGAAGELFSVRTELYEIPPQNMVIEDFYMSMRIAARGYRFRYEPDAYAVETASASVAEEWKRKVRICSGAFQAMGMLLYLLNPFRYGILSFQYVSHRVLRWTLAPLSLVFVLLSSVWLSAQGYRVYQLALGLQVFFYGMAFLGYLNRDKNISIKGFFVPYYFTVMNLAVFAGLSRFLKGSQTVLWEKAKRASTTEQEQPANP